MDHWRSHIPRNNPPKQFCERCFEQGDRKSQQNELELVLELVGDFFGRKKKCVGAGISGGGASMGPLGRGVRPVEVGALWTLVARCQLPLLCSKCQIFSNIPEKIILNWQGIWRTFIFRVFLYCTDKSENRQTNSIFYFISTK